MSDDCTDSFAEVAEWMLQNIGEDLPIQQLARRALMSPAPSPGGSGPIVGTTSAAWLNRQRIIRNQQLLEQTELSLETVAANTGFGAAAVMRPHFTKVPQVTPTAHLRTFCEHLAV